MAYKFVKGAWINVCDHSALGKIGYERRDDREYQKVMARIDIDISNQTTIIQSLITRVKKWFT